MTYENDPPRLRASGGPSDEFVLALEQAFAELPNDEQLALLAARLPDMAEAAAPRAGYVSIARTRLRAKSVQAAMLALAAAVGVGATALKLDGVFSFGRAPAATKAASEPMPTPKTSRAVPAVKAQAPAIVEEAPPAKSAVPEPLGPIAPPRSPAAAANPPRTARTSRADLPASDVDGPSAENETRLLSRAHQAVVSDPALALSLTEQHRRDYPRGALGQESDLIAIEALVGLGRRGEAQALASSFRARYPSSAHLRRLDRLVGDSGAVGSSSTGR